MRCINGDLILKEAEDAKWLAKDELYSVLWLPAEGIPVKETEKLIYNPDCDKFA